LQEMLEFQQRHGDVDSFVILGTTVSGSAGGRRSSGAVPWACLGVDGSLGASSGSRLLCISTPAAPPLLTNPGSAGQQDAGAELRLYRGKRRHAGGAGGPWGAGHGVGACSRRATEAVTPGTGATPRDSRVFPHL